MRDEDERRNQARRERQIRDFSELVGWDEDDLQDIVEQFEQMPTVLRRHHRGELLAIARDLAYEIGVELENEYQAAAIIVLFLGSGGDDDDGDEVEPEPEGEDELQPA